jgi:hypothetical protein
MSLHYGDMKLLLHPLPFILSRLFELDLWKLFSQHTVGFQIRSHGASSECVGFILHYRGLMITSYFAVSLVTSHGVVAGYTIDGGESVHASVSHYYQNTIMQERMYSCKGLSQAYM